MGGVKINDRQVWELGGGKRQPVFTAAHYSRADTQGLSPRKRIAGQEQLAAAGERTVPPHPYPLTRPRSDTRCCVVTWRSLSPW